MALWNKSSDSVVVAGRFDSGSSWKRDGGSVCETDDSKGNTRFSGFGLLGFRGTGFRGIFCTSPTLQSMFLC